MWKLKRKDGPLDLYFNSQALAQERLEGYRLHVEQAREEIEVLQVRTLSLGNMRRIGRYCALLRWVVFSVRMNEICGGFLASSLPQKNIR